MTLEDEPTGMGASTADMVFQGVVDLEQWVDRYEIDDQNREDAYAEWLLLDEVRAKMIGLCHDLEAKIAGSITGGTVVDLGGKRFKRTTERRYVQWQNEDLIRAVLDSRLVNPETGEVRDETPAEKLADVYGLKGTSARLTALKARQIDPDEFAEAQWGRKKLKDVT
jgi:hypothetical protein